LELPAEEHADGFRRYRLATAKCKLGIYWFYEQNVRSSRLSCDVLLLESRFRLTSIARTSLLPMITI
jgi:hypothetical protein